MPDDEGEGGENLAQQLREAREKVRKLERRAAAVAAAAAAAQ